MMFSRIFLLSLIVSSVLGCASYFKRKECEKTNWHQHGYSVAMSGRRLDADDFVKQCQKVEAKMSFQELDIGFKSGMAKYCTSDNIYDVGKAGKPFAFEMCDGENMKKMKARHFDGILAFCTPASGYRHGAAGGEYLNVCPKNLESDFLVEYRKGRKIYLTNMISEKEKEVARLDEEIRRLEGQRMMLSHEHAMVSNQTEVRTERIHDPKTGTYKEQTVRGPSASAQMRSQQLSSEISGVNHQIQTARDKQRDLQSELAKMRTEVVSL